MPDSPELLARFNSLDYAAIRRAVDDKDEEGIHTEYKRWSKDHYRGQLAKALSGFANSDGGIIVWGIDTVKGPNGADQANAEALIAEPDTVRVSMEAVEANATEPRVRGVQHRVVMHPNGGGFIVTFIPASEGGPHMAKLSHDRFYRRDAIGHHLMGQAELGDMFGRRARPSLTLARQAIKAEVVRATSPQNHYPAYMEIISRIFIGWSNGGRGLARFPAARITLKPADVDFTIDTLTYPPVGVTQLPSPPVEDRPFIFAGGADSAIHAGTELQLIVMKRSNHVELVDGRVVIRKEIPDLIIEHTLSAEGIPSKFGTLIVPSADIAGVVLGMKHDGVTLEEWFNLPKNQSWVKRTKLPPAS